MKGTYFFNFTWLLWFYFCPLCLFHIHFKCHIIIIVPSFDFHLDSPTCFTFLWIFIFCIFELPFRIIFLCLKNSLSISFHIGLLVRWFSLKHLYLTLIFEKHCHCSMFTGWQLFSFIWKCYFALILEVHFTGYKILGWQLFALPSNCFATPCLLPPSFWWEVSDLANHALSTFKIFSLFLVFSR